MSTTLLQGDCLDILPTLPDKCADAIITDLPYGTTACKWDVIIPLDKMWEQVKRLCKGAFVTTASQPFTSVLIMSNLKWFKYDWVWEKNAGSNFANVKYQPFREHESVLVFSKNGHTYNPQMIYRSEASLKRDPIGTKRILKPNKLHGKTIEKYAMPHANERTFRDDGLRNPRSIVKFDTERFPKGFAHPTSKPVALYEYLIKTYTNEGDTVLDFCMGSGTTGVACVKTNRNFIGIEKQADYFEIAQRRIQEAQQMVMEM